MRLVECREKSKYFGKQRNTQNRQHSQKDSLDLKQFFLELLHGYVRRLEALSTRGSCTAPGSLLMLPVLSLVCSRESPSVTVGSPI